MPGTEGWVIVQRELGGDVTVDDAPEVWATLVLAPPDALIVGSNVAGSAGASLAAAIHQAVHAPAAGPRPAQLAFVQAPPDLVEQAAKALETEGLRMTVDAAATPDWAEDVMTRLVGHLAGRQQAEDPPGPEEWALLYRMAAAYARAQPWKRQADDAHLRLDLKIGSHRETAVAFVLGSPGTSMGLAVCPGSEVPTEFLTGDETAQPPEGTVHLFLEDRAKIPPDLLERASRYGWPGDRRVPVFIERGGDGLQEIGRAGASVLMVALAAATEHDRQGAGFGIDVKGEILLAGGRRARYTARLEPDVPFDIPSGFTLRSGEVRDDWIPEGTGIGLGGLPWSELEWARSHAQRHLPPPVTRSAQGDALPLLLLHLDDEQGNRLASQLEAAHPEGVALLEAGAETSLIIISDAGMRGVLTVASRDETLARFKKRLTAAEGWHAILVTRPNGAVEGVIYGLFECVLLPPPPTRSPQQRPQGTSKRRQRRR